MKIKKITRLCFAVAALLLGTLLRNELHSDVFFFLGLIACCAIFAFLGRREQFEAEKKAKEEKRKRR